jgi:hypothetical protein
MNKLVVAVVLVAILLGSVAIVLLSNSNSPSSSNNNQGSLTVDSSGRIVTSSDSRVEVNVPANAVSNPITLSIEKNNEVPSVSGFTSVLGYKFGPEGTVFQKPVTITISYDQSALPSSADESALRLFWLHNNVWEELDNSSVNVNQNVVSGQISHFSFVNVGYGSNSGNISPTPNPSSSGNGSATYVFTVSPLFYGFTGESYTDSYNETFTSYYYTAYVAWEPFSYVRYYEVEYHFNGNNPGIVVRPGDFRGNNELLAYPRTETITYILGGTGSQTASEHFIGSWSTFIPDNTAMQGRHGVCLITVSTTVSSKEGLSGQDLSLMDESMTSYVQNLVRGWTLTIRPVT